MSLENLVEDAEVAAPETFIEAAPEAPEAVVVNEADDAALTAAAAEEVAAPVAEVAVPAAEVAAPAVDSPEVVALKAEVASLKSAAAPKVVAPVVAAKPVDDLEFFLNPKEAMKRMMAEITSEQTAAAKVVADAQGALAVKHPDAPAVFASPEFAAWRDASPIRAKLVLEAHKNLDVELGAYLLDDFKATSKPAKEADPIVDSTSEADATAVSTAEKAAKALKDATASVGQGGAAVAPAPKGYTTAGLARMQVNDPDEYDRQQPQIIAAYAAGLVR